MDFSIPTETQELLEKFTDFMEREVIPLESAGARSSFREILPQLDENRRQVKELGLWAPQVPMEYGGMGLGFMDYALVCEVIGRSLLGPYVFGSQAPDAGNIEILIEFGDDAQKEEWLEPLALGEIRSCFSMTEPECAGSNPTRLRTTAVREGDEYVINGHKWFTSAAEGAAFAIVMAVTDPGAEPHLRASLIIVPTETPGFRRVRNISCMGHEGGDWNSHAEIRYEQCRVPAGNLLGEEGRGFAMAQARLGPGRIHHCMRWIGIAERSFELMCRYAATRELAPGKVLASRQTIQNWIAESRAEINASRLMVLEAAWKIDRVGAKEARIEISTIKFFVAGMLQRVIDRAMQTHGALGISDDTILASFYRNERAARIYDGPDEVHKSVVARRILKEYGATIE